MVRKLFIVVNSAWFLCIALLFSGDVNASFIINGTRVIYDAASKGKTVDVSNPDDFPSVLQAWIAADENNDDPEKAKAPFIISPTVARVDAKSSQSLRIIYTGKDLPTDRESLFYLNVIQVPAKNIDNESVSALQFIFRNQLKLFFRPAGINKNANAEKKEITFKLLDKDSKKWSIKVDSKSPYYTSFIRAVVSVGGVELALKASMVAPYSEQTWYPEESVYFPSGKAVIKVWLINDYGAREERNYELPL